MDDNVVNQLTERALQFVNEKHKSIVRDAIAAFPPEKAPVSIFMAGSPGAGKTETSKRLLKNTENILRIDADELRDHFKSCGYTGKNSHLFQYPAIKLVDKMHDAALEHKISFLLDGPLARESKARENIERSLSPKRNRAILIIFVYQLPEQAWFFVRKRELAEGRRIRAEEFAEKFCASRDVVNRMKEEFGDRIELSLLCKNIDGSNKFYRKNIDCIDNHIPEKYTEKQILDEIRC